MIKDEGATITGVIHDIRTKKDGGGRIQIDFGADSLEAIQWIQRLATFRDCSFSIAFVPIQPGVLDFEQHGGDEDEFTPDENGEIPL